jgi:hypothetical protein
VLTIAKDEHATAFRGRLYARCDKWLLIKHLLTLTLSFIELFSFVFDST